MHLTGVDTYLPAREFYNKALNRKITTNQFYFSKIHTFANAKKKLSCLKQLPELTKNYVCILKDHITPTIVYKLSVSNLKFTVGLTENLDFNGSKINDIYLPQTLRVNDKAVEKSKDGEIVDFIFVRDASIDTYHDVLLADQSKVIPQEIFDLLDEKFYKK